MVGGEEETESGCDIAREAIEVQANYMSVIFLTKYGCNISHKI